MQKRIGLGTSIALAVVLGVAGVRPAYSASAQWKAYPWIQDSEFEQLKREAAQRSSSRKISSASLNCDTQVSKPFQQFRERLFKAQTGDDLHTLLIEAEKHYDEAPNDLKLALAEMLPLQALRGVVFRMVPLASQSKLAHTALLTMMMRLASNFQMMFPDGDSQAMAAFRYVTEPYQNVVTFKEFSGFQGYLNNELYPVLFKAADRISKINTDQPVLVDAKVLYGTGSFPDDLDRCRLFQTAEKNALLATKHLGMANLKTFVSYSMNNLMEINKQLGTLYGVDALMRITIRGVTSKMVAETIRKFPSDFVLYEDGSVSMGDAFGHLKEMVRRTSLAWIEVKGRPADGLRLFNPEIANAFSREFEEAIPTWEKIISGPTDLRSRVTGEVVTVNLPALYQYPPADLKALLPTDCPGDDGVCLKKNKDEWLTKTLTLDGVESRVKYRNYLFESPKHWNVKPDYKRLFPKITNATEVPKFERIVMQSWGGSMIGLPLSAFVQ